MLNDKGKAVLRLYIMLMIQFIFILLKLTGAIGWSWIVVLIPIWIVIFFELLSIILILWLINRG